MICGTRSPQATPTGASGAGGGRGSFRETNAFNASLHGILRRMVIGVRLCVVQIGAPHDF